MNTPLAYQLKTNQWDSPHLAQGLFGGLEGDLQVHQVQPWKQHFENLPQQLKNEGIDPRVPWLYNFKVDFSFK